MSRGDHEKSGGFSRAFSLRLPVRHEGTAWDGPAPDPLDDPDLFDGVVWRRAFAYVIDACVIAILLFLAWIVLGTLTVLSFGLLLPIKALGLTLLPTAYHTWFLGSGGATPGMRLFDVEVRSWTGRRPDFFQAFLQTVLFYMTVVPTSGLVLIVALFNRRQRCLHDFLAGTVGIRHSRVSLDRLRDAYS